MEPLENNLILTGRHVGSLIGPRRRDCNKGDNGRGLMIAGAPGMTGAAVMSAAAALRGGVGLLKVISTQAGVEALRALPEAMTVSIQSNRWEDCARQLVEPLLKEATAVCFGPGFGREKAAENLLCWVLEAKKPTVVDADGLFALAQIKDKSSILHNKVVLTPHFGEMARLTGLPIEKIKEQQAEIALEYAQRWGCTVLLKGTQSVIAAPNGRYAWNRTGNPGLAKGGSGDVLSGIVLAMLCQGLSPFDGACAGAYLLGTSADEALELLKERMLLARDVTDAIERTISHTL